jgi:hypothetical protein
MGERKSISSDELSRACIRRDSWGRKIRMSIMTNSMANIDTAITIRSWMGEKYVPVEFLFVPNMSTLYHGF